MTACNTGKSPRTTPGSSLFLDGKYTMELCLCDDAGKVAGEFLGTLNRLRRMTGLEPYTGDAFPCTGSAHLAGEHIRCTSPAHPANVPQVAADALPERPERDDNPLPEDLERLLRDPNIAIPQDELVHAMIIADLRRHPERTVPRNAYLNLWALYKAATS